jgi:hypothetical protein
LREVFFYPSLFVSFVLLRPTKVEPFLPINLFNKIHKRLAHNDGLQLRRAISIQAEGKKLLEKELSRRQLQGFVRRVLGKDIHHNSKSCRPCTTAAIVIPSSSTR